MPGRLHHFLEIDIRLPAAYSKLSIPIPIPIPTNDRKRMVVIVDRPSHHAAPLGAESDQCLVLQGGGVSEILPRFVFRAGCSRVVWICGSFGEQEVDRAEGGEAGGDDAQVDFGAGPDDDGGDGPADVGGGAVESGADDEEDDGDGDDASVEREWRENDKQCFWEKGEGSFACCFR